jgi:hypothetical protein
LSQKKAEEAKENYQRTYSFTPKLSPLVEAAKEGEKEINTQEGKEEELGGGEKVRKELKLKGTLQEHISKSESEKRIMLERERRNKYTIF